jgi:hypothetical protein
LKILERELEALDAEMTSAVGGQGDRSRPSSPAKSMLKNDQVWLSLGFAFQTARAQRMGWARGGRRPGKKGGRGNVLRLQQSRGRQAAFPARRQTRLNAPCTPHASRPHYSSCCVTARGGQVQRNAHLPKRLSPPPNHPSNTLTPRRPQPPHTHPRQFTRCALPAPHARAPWR